MNPSVAAEVNAVLLSAGVNISNDPKAAIPKEKLITALKFLRVIAALRGFTSFSYATRFWALFPFPVDSLQIYEPLCYACLFAHLEGMSEQSILLATRWHLLLVCGHA